MGQNEIATAPSPEGATDTIKLTRRIPGALIEIRRRVVDRKAGDFVIVVNVNKPAGARPRPL
jgi:hypothetical protein